MSHEWRYLDQNISTSPLQSEIIDPINRRNSLIETLQSDVTIRYSGFNLFASLSYSKDRNLRMKIRSRFAMESDIGSNDEHFWFWSRRISPPTLYFARHEDYMLTRLRTPFDPNWIIDCLNVNIIDNQNVYQYGDHLMTREEYLNNLGVRVVRIRIIDIDKEMVVGNYITDLTGNVIASYEISEMQYIDGFWMPKKASIYWSEENIVLNWEYSNIVINKPINSNLWIMPRHRNTVDMSNMP